MNGLARNTLFALLELPTLNLRRAMALTPEKLATLHSEDVILNDLEPSTRGKEQITEEERNSVEATPPPTGIGVYERPKRNIASTAVIGLVVFFLLLIIAYIILFVL